MKASATQLAYRSAATHGATHIGLLLVVYDGLALDLGRAAEASARQNITLRCQASNHALQLLAHLESWLPFLEDTTLSGGLQTFYAFLRAEILRLQQTSTPDGFLALSSMVVETRAVWQRKEKESLLRAAPLSINNDPERSSNEPTRHSPGLAWSV